MGVHAAVYLRISEDRSGGGLGVERQREDCAALCEARGWEYTVYADNDVSASGTKRRPQYQKMLADIEAGRVQALVVWDLDRLTRRPVEIEHIIDVADRKNLMLASIGGDVDLSTDNGRLFARIKGAVARAEVERKSARQVRAREQAATKGLIVGGPRAFGYTKGQSVHPEEAPQVREMYRRLLEGGSLRGICRWLNDAGATTPTGNAWTLRSVRLVLLNPRYCGLRGVRRLIPGTSGQREQYHEIVGKGQWDPIVGENEWRSALRILQDPARRTTPGGARRHLLSGLAQCYCGEKLRVGAVARKGGNAPLLLCPEGHVARVMAPIEEFVVEVLLARLERADGVPLLQRPVAVGSEVDPAVLAARAEDGRQRLLALAEDYGAGLLSRPEFLAARDATSKVIADCDRLLSREAEVSAVARLARSGVAPRVAWAEWGLDERRALLDQVCTVTVHRGRPGRAPFDPDTVTVLPRG